MKKCIGIKLMKHTCINQRSTIWAASWQNQQKGMCAQRRLRSARASAGGTDHFVCFVVRRLIWLIGLPCNSQNVLVWLMIVLFLAIDQPKMQSVNTDNLQCLAHISECDIMWEGTQQTLHYCICTDRRLRQLWIAHCEPRLFSKRFLDS